MSARASKDALFRQVARVGGKRGWYFADWLWRLRGAIDVLFGGVGMRRGRKSPDTLVVGDALDWWRVEAFEPNRLLRLAAEMKLPGRGWLQFEISGDKETSTLRLTVEYDPLGLFGLVYWYAVYPLHAFVFQGMLRAMVRSAEAPQNIE